MKGYPLFRIEINIEKIEEKTRNMYVMCLHKKLIKFKVKINEM